MPDFEIAWLPPFLRSSLSRQALVTHPDKNSSPLAPDAFQRLSEAFDCLSEPQNQREYIPPWAQGEEGKKEKVGREETKRKQEAETEDSGKVVEEKDMERGDAYLISQLVLTLWNYITLHDLATVAKEAMG